MRQNPPKQAVGSRASIRGFGVPPTAWLSELEAQHRRLTGIFVGLIERLCRVPNTLDRCESHAELLALFADADQLLRAHFAFEEAGEYLSDALAIAPRLSRRAGALQRDHVELTTHFSKLVGFARERLDTDQSWKRLEVAVEEFARDLRVHELEENRLIQEASLDDLGGG